MRNTQTTTPKIDAPLPIASADQASRARGHRMARASDETTTVTVPLTEPAPLTRPTTPRTTGAPNKLDLITALLLRTEGASIAEMTGATGWQAHSVRGAMAGALKKRGVIVTSDKVDGLRHYRASREA
jgi:hypothetical protein